MTSRKPCKCLKYVSYRLLVNWNEFESLQPRPFRTLVMQVISRGDNLIDHRKVQSLKSVGAT